MTTERRIRIKITRGSGPSLLICLALVVLSLACGVPNNDNKPITADSSGGNQAANSGSQAQNAQMVPDEVLVKFNPDAQPETIERIQAELRLSTLRQFHSTNLFLMKITDGSAVEAIVSKLKAYPAVEYAEPNYVVKANP